MRFHVLGLPHTVSSKEFNACAYTQKVVKFCKMMSARGHYIIHYGHEDSDVICNEHVSVITNKDWKIAYGDYDWRKNFFKFDVEDHAYKTFFKNAIEEVAKRKQPLDFILPFWGSGVRPICDAHSDMICVEPGIGYAGGHWARWKIFESYAIYHAYCGMQNVGYCNQDWYEVVIPNYFDLEDFDYSEEKDDYFLFLGRVFNGKGIELAIQMTEKIGAKLIVAGQNPDNMTFPNHVEYIGYADIETRKRLLSRAKGLIIGSMYIEPFGGVQVEALLSGTPTITTDWGAFVENNINGVTGYRCRTFEDFVNAGKNIDNIKPSDCRKFAEKFSLENVALMYEKYFQDVLNVHTNEGWYHIENDVIDCDQHNDYEMEKSFWNDCTNTFDEDQKHYVYARHMNIKQDYYSFDVEGKSILDIGGGPSSMLLKTINLKKGKVIDPIEYPKWTIERYNSKNIDVLVDIGENVNEEGWDEVWIYNCLQHVIDPQKIIENAKKSAKVLRIFEWINIPPHDGHPHCLTKENLDAWIGGSGNTTQLAETGCWGECYYGEFSFECDNDVIDYNQIESEEKPFADRLAIWIKENINPKKVVDIGCGPGTYVYSLIDNDVNAYGYDIDDRVEGKDYLKKLSLFEVNDKSDVVICLEVAEHIETSLSDSIVDSIIRNVNDDGMIIWTAAIPGQGGVGHINCQTKEYWEEKFISRGFYRDFVIENNLLEYIRSGPYMEWFSQNLMVFKDVYNQIESKKTIC
jgi:glycosyltransferase involved in cell wall biosynthesis/2-polyprenyl-3-methyl-5-hydroxy-6-metoxy-1,4-benzoquinol methylase